MRKKNGFTLIELLGVLIILTLLLAVAVPTIEQFLRSSRNKLYNTQLINIENAARLWGTKNMFNLPKAEGESVTISLLQLKLSGFIDYNIKNPRTQKLFPDDMSIVITRHGNGYVYDILTDTGSSNEILDSTAPLITLNGGISQNVEINTPYQELGATAESRNHDALKVNIRVTKDGKDTSMDTSVLGSYEIIYSASADGKTSTIKRRVNIVDTIAPVLVCSTCESLTISVESSKDYILPTVTATDNSVKGNLTVTKIGSFSSVIPGRKVVTYEAIDASGNRGTLELTFDVADTKAPTLEVASSVNPSTKVTTLTVTSSDSGTGLATYAYSFDGGKTFQMSPSAVFTTSSTVHVVVRDKVGNTASKDVTV